MVLWFYVPELPKAQPAVVLVASWFKNKCLERVMYHNNTKNIHVVLFSF